MDLMVGNLRQYFFIFSFIFNCLYRIDEMFLFFLVSNIVISVLKTIIFHILEIIPAYNVASLHIEKAPALITTLVHNGWVISDIHRWWPFTNDIQDKLKKYIYYELKSHINT